MFDASEKDDNNLPAHNENRLEKSPRMAKQTGVPLQEKAICLLLMNQAFTESFCQNLNSRGEKSVVIQVSNAKEFFLTNQQQCSLVVLDPKLNIPGEISFADLLHSLNIDYVMLDNTVHSVFLAKALGHHSRGYLTNQCSLKSLLETISNLASGKQKNHYCAQSIELIDNSGSKPKMKTENTVCSLTDRQLEVMTHLAEGKTVKEVGHILHLSHKSIDSHKYRIMNRLHVHDRVHLSRLAIREGLIEP